MKPWKHNPPYGGNFLIMLIMANRLFKTPFWYEAHPVKMLLVDISNSNTLKTLTEQMIANSAKRIEFHHFLPESDEDKIIQIILLILS